MLKQILSISGKPGLFKLISKSKVTLIVESLSDKKRMPIHSSDKVVSLGDISMFTNEGEKALWEILEDMKTKENSEKASISPKSSANELKNYLEEILPDYDREKVYPSDVKKLISWYNLLLGSGYSDFKPKEEEKESEETKEIAAEEEKEA